MESILCVLTVIPHLNTDIELSCCQFSVPSCLPAYSVPIHAFLSICLPSCLPVCLSFCQFLSSFLVGDRQGRQDGRKTDRQTCRKAGRSAGSQTARRTEMRGWGQHELPRTPGAVIREIRTVNTCVIFRIKV